MRRKSTAFVVQALERLESKYGVHRMIPRFTPMDELVSCILSQHTTDANSFPAFTRLVARYRTWDAVVAAGEEGVANEIRNAGLANQKSKSIISCLKEIHRRTGAYDLELLRSMPTLEAREWLQSLPGVGPKTASIVLCFAFGRESIPVDTHVYRTSWRIGFIDEGVGEVKAHDLLLKLAPPSHAFRFHSTLIQHGRATCRAPIPDCKACPITDLCRWYAQDGPSRRARKMKRARGKAK